MAAEQTIGTESSIVVVFHVTAEQIEAKRAQFAGLSFDTPKNYAEGVKAIAECRDMRGDLEKRREELVAPALAHQRAVNATAKALTGVVTSIEEPLKAKKKAVDDEKARIKAEAERAELRALEERLKAEREAEEARLRAEREVEEARLAEERKSLAAERAGLVAQQLEQAQARAAEAAELKRQQDEVSAQRRALEAEQERLRPTPAAVERVQALADDVVCTLSNATEVILDGARAKLSQTMQTDLDRLRDFAHAIRSLRAPECGADAAQIVDSVVKQLGRAAAALDAFVARSK